MGTVFSYSESKINQNCENFGRKKILFVTKSLIIKTEFNDIYLRKVSQF